MCAIVGGVVASEVIKVISGKGAPINNAFFFDALQTSEGAPPSRPAAQPPSRPAAWWVTCREADPPIDTSCCAAVCAGSVQRLGPSYSCPWGNDAGKPRVVGGVPVADL